MNNFKKFLEQEKQPIVSPPLVQPKNKKLFPQKMQKLPGKVWSMNKDDTLKYWQVLKPNSPIIVDPIPANHKGSTYGQDGIRLTGSRRFIDAVLGRIKDIIQYENPNTKLNLVYRQHQYRGISQSPEKIAFVFYAQVRNRDKPKFYP